MEVLEAQEAETLNDFWAKLMLANYGRSLPFRKSPIFTGLSSQGCFGRVAVTLYDLHSED